MESASFEIIPPYATGTCQTGVVSALRGALGVALGCCLLFAPRPVSVVAAGCAAGVGREREEPHEEPYSEGRESHPSTYFA